jgi:hypothetical protein
MVNNLKQGRTMQMEIEYTFSGTRQGDKDGGDLCAGRIRTEMKEHEADIVSKRMFCALEYVDTSDVGASRTFKNVILLVVQHSDGVLQFLVHPNLHEVVCAFDLAYIKSVLEDFLERASLHSKQLFHQLCSLAVGPLQTWEVAEDFTQDSDLRGLAQQFVAI